MGAGVAGLTAGYLLSRAGWKVSVVEREGTVGGLARSFHYDGFTFDIGPHRFHTEDQEVLRFILSVLAEEATSISRSSGVFMFSRYHDWPLRPSSVAKLPIGLMLGAARDILRNRKPAGDSFEDYVVGLYGPTLYRTFFKPYTLKFLKEHPERIHRDWAAAGMRAVVDRRVPSGNLSQVVRGALLPRPVRRNEIYPKCGGVGVFCQRLAEEISRRGEICLKSMVTRLGTTDGRVSSATLSDGTRFTPRVVVWTAPITTAASLLQLPPTGLDYMSTVCYNLEVDGPPPNDYQWCYFGQEEIAFNRTTTTTLFSPDNAPPGKTGICIEVTCKEDEDLWVEPMALLSTIQEHLKSCRMIKERERIERIHVERVSNTYPIYEIDYPTKLDRAVSRIARIPNLLLVGRTGRFWYNQMDHSMRAAFDTVRGILNEKK